MSLYDAVRELPLSIESYALDPLELQARADFLRKTTIIRLGGGGEEGLGEDVTYHGEEHDRLQGRGPDLPLTGSWTLHAFSEHLATLPLFDAEPVASRESSDATCGDCESASSVIRSRATSSPRCRANASSQAWHSCMALNAPDCW